MRHAWILTLIFEMKERRRTSSKASDLRKVATRDGAFLLEIEIRFNMFSPENGTNEIEYYEWLD